MLKRYDTPIEPGNPRRTEAWALMQAAVRMKRAQDSGDVEEMRMTARLNWRLWTILQADLLEPTSPVPAEIRSNMLSLAAFVDKQTVAFLAENNPSLLNSMISVNREISRGLSETDEATTAPASQPETRSEA